MSVPAPARKASLSKKYKKLKKAARPGPDPETTDPEAVLNPDFSAMPEVPSGTEQNLQLDPPTAGDDAPTDKEQELTQQMAAADQELERTEQLLERVKRTNQLLIDQQQKEAQAAAAALSGEAAALGGQEQQQLPPGFPGQDDPTNGQGSRVTSR